MGVYPDDGHLRVQTTEAYQTRLEALLARLTETERMFAEFIARLQVRNDRLLGELPEQCGVGGIGVPSQPLLNNLDTIADRLTSQAHRLHDEVDRACEVG